MKSIIAICLILGLVGTTLATVTPTTNSPGTFNKGPFTVLNAVTAGNTTDLNSWGTGNTAIGGTTAAAFLAVNTKFGPGADNATIWLYGADYATTANKYYIISRKINSTQIANGSTNTAAEESVLASNGGLLATVTWTGTAGATMATGVAPGSFLLAQGETSTATGAVATLSFYVVTGASFTTKALATSSTTVTAATGTTGYAYGFAPLSVWYEDSAYYCLYEYQVTTTPPSGTGAANSAAVMIQGYNSSALIYTTPVTVLSATTTLPGTLGTAILTPGAAGGSNYTNSTYWLVTFRDATALKTYFYTVTQDGKTVTAVGTLTDSGTGTTAVAYSTGGIVPSQANATYGFLVGYSTGTSSPTYNLSFLLNGTATPVTTYFSLGTPSAVPTGAGLGYSTGYAVLARVVTSATATSYYLNAFFANGTANTTAMASQQSVGSFQDSGAGAVPVGVFADVNGSVWIGYGTGDTVSPYNILTASVARLVETTRAYYPAAAGNVLVTIAALLSFVIASLFMF